MTKILVNCPNLKRINEYKNHSFDGFILGIEGYSENFNNYVKINELQTYLNEINKLNKDVYIFLNKLYFEEEISGLKDVIKELINNNIINIGFTDYSVLNIINDMKYDKNIIWISNHLGTNSNTINYLNKFGVNKVFLSTEITKDEIISIKNNVNCNVIVKMYGHLLMATSSRKLLSNYFKYINKNKDKDLYTFKDIVKNKDYLIKEEDNSLFLTKDVLNGLLFLKELYDNKVDYIYLDDYLIDDKKFLNIIDAYSDGLNNIDDVDFINKLNEVVKINTENNTFNGFLDKKTVFRVNDYE
jgi:collagenase-like PrtC family protease